MPLLLIIFLSVVAIASAYRLCKSNKKIKHFDSLKENISWASAHLGDRTLYDKFRVNELTPWELMKICQQYRAHRHGMSMKRNSNLWKRRDKRILSELDVLIRDVYKVMIYNHKIDLSMYGVKNNF